jgi:hypothetical protein
MYIYIYIIQNIIYIIYNIKWAGLVRPNRLGRTQPKKCWADFGPKMDWAHKLVFSSGPDPAQKAGLGQDPPGPEQNGRGELISPHPCMQNATRSACREGKNKHQKRGGRRVTWRGVAVASCVSGGAVAEAGGGDLLTGSDSRRRCGCFRRFGSFSPFLPFSSFSRFAFFSVVFGLVLPLFPFLFSVFFFSLPSLSFVLSLPLSLLCFFGFSFSPSVPLLNAAVLVLIYRAK